MLTVILLTLLAVGQLIIGTLLWIESRHTKRVDQQIFAILSFTMVLWIASVGILIGVDTTWAVEHVTLIKVSNIAAFFLSAAILTLVYVFSLNYPIKLRLTGRRRLFIAAGIGLCVLSVTPLVSGTFKMGTGELLYTYGPLTFLISVFAVSSVGAVFFAEGQTLRTTHDPALLKQSKTLLTGLILTIAHTLLFVLALPAVFGQNPLFYAIGYAAPYYLTIFTGYGLVRQRLFDVRTVAARAVAYIFSSALVALLYATVAILASTLVLDESIPGETVVLFIVTTLIVAFLFQPLKVFFNKITNRVFYRDYYDPQDVLDRLSNLLVRTVDVDEMMTRTAQILKETLRPQSVDFLFFAVADTKAHQDLRRHLMKATEPMIITNRIDTSRHSGLYKALHSQDIALAVRLRTTHDDLGYLLLGTRQSGVVYSSQDIRLLNVIADELGIGLQNAFRFQEIENFNATLQGRITDATRQLRRTNDKLRSLDQTKDDFISMASHQLRTPLTSVKGYVSMVLDGDAGKISPLQRKLLNQAFVSSQRMVYLISDLLNVSRLRTGKFIIEPIPSNLAAVIQEEVSQLVETAKGRNLELIYDRPEHFPTYMFDETKLRQVIMNFVDNAIYYTPSGGRIIINLIEKPMSIEFTVVDNGIGVPKIEQHHLFTKFFRANNAKRARPDGTGLGLFMAKKVVIAQGGAIIFKSQEGKGSTFGFSFAKDKLTPVPEKNLK